MRGDFIDAARLDIAVDRVMDVLEMDVTDMGEGTVEAGWAKCEITPDEPVLMGGYGFRMHRSMGVYMPLRVGVLYLRSSEGDACLVTLDVVNLGLEDAALIRDRLEDELGLNHDTVILLPSHTHSGPLLHRAWAGMAVSEIGMPEHRLRERFAEAIVACARIACETAAPARLETASGASAMGISRRGPNGSRMPNRRGITDPTVTTLIVSREGEEETPCVVFAYGCHPTTRSGYLLGPDFPGPARLYLEERHPGLMSFFIQGFEGDVRPANVDENNRWLTHECFLDKVACFGEQLGREVDRIYRYEARVPLAGPVRAKQISLQLPLELDGMDNRLARAERSEKPSHQKWARTMRERLQAGATFDRTVPLVMHGFALGNTFGFLGIGGEVCSGYARGFRERFPDTPLLLSALTDNNVASYLPTEQIRREGGYEAEIYLITGRPGPYAAGIEQLIHQAGSDLLARLLQNSTSDSLARDHLTCTALL